MGGHYALAGRHEPALFFFYVSCWWSYIIFLESVLLRRNGQYTFLNKDLPFFILLSCAFWCCFELINLRLENWFYVCLPGNFFIRYVNYLLAYGTVIPAITLTAMALQPFFRSVRVTPLKIRGYSSMAILLGIILFLLTVTFPEYLFPLAWAFAIPLVDGINCRFGFKSFMADLQSGDASRILSALSSGLLCGVLWETWNYISPVRWIYTVPFFENMKIFEMPLPGYIGFLVFGIETIAFMDLLQGLRGKKTSAAILITCSIAVCTIAFPLIDRYTVFSYNASVEQLSFLTGQEKERLHSESVKTSIGIDSDALGPESRKAFDIISLKGLGYKNYLKLAGHGITGIQDLKGMDETKLSHILKEKNLRRVRVYLRAAQKH